MEIKRVEQDLLQRTDKLRELLPEMVELGRMRSDFALDHFVVGQHDMPGRQRAQALVELQSMYFGLGEVYDDLRLAQLDLEEKPRETPRQKIAAEGLERRILQLSINIYQRIKEIDHLIELLGKMPKYTAEQLEKEEAVYWATRLPRQAYLMPRDPGGNLDALLQYITKPGEDKPVLPAGPHTFLLGLGIDAKVLAERLKEVGILSEEAAKYMISAQAKAPKFKRKRHK